MRDGAIPVTTIPFIRAFYSQHRSQGDLLSQLMSFFSSIPSDDFPILDEARDLAVNTSASDVPVDQLSRGKPTKQKP